MDCYFHANVPSIAPCAECSKPICATCRDERGSCPSCRLAAKVDAATGTRQQLGGTVPPRPQPAAAAVRGKAEVTTVLDPLESRGLVALGYPLWPLALLALFDRKQSKYLKRQAIQALAVNAGFALLWCGFSAIDQFLGWIPFIAGAPYILHVLLLPIFLVSTVYFGIKAWQGEEVRVPIISDWLDDRIPAN